MSRWPLVIIVILVLVAIYWLIFEPFREQAQFQIDLPRSTQNNESFEMPVKISVSSAANAAELYFQFPPDLLSVEEIKTTDSVFQLWVKESPGYDNDQGTIYLAGGSPNPGFTGSDLLVARVKFKAKKLGTATLALEEKSRLLANDGQGNQIRANFQAKSIIIK